MAMGHHFLPQFYLRGFAIADSLWVHDRERATSFRSQPKAVANENQMYTEELEQVFANLVEQPAKSAIEKIRALQPLEASERFALARYVVALWKRVPKARSRVALNLPSAAAEVQAELEEQLRQAAQADPAFAPRAAVLSVQVREFLAGYLPGAAIDLWHKILSPDQNQAVVESLLSMEWRFLVTPTANHFLTSDNPVFFFEHEGIGNPASELTLPFAANVALWANRRMTGGPAYQTTRRAAVMEINRRTAYNATRFAYSARAEPWILPFVLKQSPPRSRLL